MERKTSTICYYKARPISDASSVRSEAKAQFRSITSTWLFFEKREKKMICSSRFVQRRSKHYSPTLWRADARNRAIDQRLKCPLFLLDSSETRVIHLVCTTGHDRFHPTRFFPVNRSSRLYFQMPTHQKKESINDNEITKKTSLSNKYDFKIIATRNFERQNQGSLSAEASSCEERTQERTRNGMWCILHRSFYCL